MIVVDASFLMRLLIEAPETEAAENLWRRWHEQQRPVLAPGLLRYEITNALHRYVRHGYLEPTEARALFGLVEGFRIEHIPGDDLHERAMSLATELDLPATYDTHYLALAEQRKAELWTADRKLARGVRQHFARIRLLEADTSDPD